MPIYIKKFFESTTIKKQIASWKSGETTRVLRNKIIKAYGRNKAGGQFLHKETIAYIEEHVLPHLVNMTDNNFSHLRSRFINYMLKEKNIVIVDK